LRFPVDAGVPDSEAGGTDTPGDAAATGSKGAGFTGVCEAPVWSVDWALGDLAEAGKVFFGTEDEELLDELEELLEEELEAKEPADPTDAGLRGVRLPEMRRASSLPTASSSSSSASSSAEEGPRKSCDAPEADTRPRPLWGLKTDVAASWTVWVACESGITEAPAFASP